jgi:hypothetical protein
MAAVFPFEAQVGEFTQQRWVLRVPIREPDERHLEVYKRLMALNNRTRQALGIPAIGVVAEVFPRDVAPHPIPGIIMEEVNGVPLDRFLEYHSAEKRTMLELAINWRDRLLHFESFQFSHNDLQHGNVLVGGSATVNFIDFDDSYLPGLTHAIGLGHPNYQHPGVGPEDWGPFGDAYPGLLIWLAIRAVAYDHSLYAEFGDQGSMLFRRGDLEEPGNTALWHRLFASDDSRVRAAAKTLAELTLASRPPLTSFRELLPDWI